MIFGGKRYDAETISTTETLFPGGDFFNLVSSSVGLTITFYGEKKNRVARFENVRTLELDFFNGMLFDRILKGQSLDPEVQGRNIPELPRAFAWVGIKTASSTAVPVFIITNGGINARALEFAGNVQISAVSTRSDTSKQTLADTDTYTVAARSNRRQLVIQSSPKNAAGSYVHLSSVIDKSLILPPSGFRTYDWYDGAVTVYSEGANDVHIEEVY